MKEKWQALQQREQLLVIAMSVFIVVFIFYWAVWQPLNSNIASQQKKIEKQQEILAWVDKNIALYRSQRGAKVTTNQSLTTLVNRAAQQLNISIARMQPQGEELQVTIDEVSFNQLLTLVETLALQSGVYVNVIDVSPTDKSGVVRVRRLLLGKG